MTKCVWHEWWNAETHFLLFPISCSGMRDTGGVTSGVCNQPGAWYCLTSDTTQHHSPLSSLVTSADLHPIYTLSTHYLHTIYTLSTHYLHTIYTLSTHPGRARGIVSAPPLHLVLPRAAAPRGHRHQLLQLLPAPPPRLCLHTQERFAALQVTCYWVCVCVMCMDNGCFARSIKYFKWG